MVLDHLALTRPSAGFSVSRIRGQGPKDVPPDSIRTIAQRAADAVIGSLASPLTVDGRDVALGASVGIAVFPEHGRTTEELLRSADRAMYAAKAAGHGRAKVAPAPRRTGRHPDSSDSRPSRPSQ